MADAFGAQQQSLAYLRAGVVQLAAVYGKMHARVLAAQCAERFKKTQRLALAVIFAASQIDAHHRDRDCG